MHPVRDGCPLLVTRFYNLVPKWFVQRNNGVYMRFACGAAYLWSCIEVNRKRSKAQRAPLLPKAVREVIGAPEGENATHKAKRQAFLRLKSKEALHQWLVGEGLFDAVMRFDSAGFGKGMLFVRECVLAKLRLGIHFH